MWYNACPDIRHIMVFLLTYVHPLVKSYHNNSIMIRRINDEDFVLKADLVHVKLTWDIALLVFRDVKNKICKWWIYFSASKPIIHHPFVDHLVDMIWYVFVGRATYQCLDTFISFSRHIEYHYSTTPVDWILGHI